ncbi:MAG: hypothetical protein E6J60_10945 [Deltaproteobacteria bacterium]|nr:MAG: hypothetical protein E6J60_10945 [Deltaproteobacteria bacterium]
MRRLRRWLARGLVAVALVATALAVASRTGAVRALERRAVVRVLESATGERVTLAGVGGTLGHSLVLEDLRLTAGGRTVVHVPRLEIVYAPLALVHGVVRLKRVTLTGPRVRAVREGDAGALALPPGGGLPVEIDHLEVTGGRVAVALLDTEPPRRFAATALALAARGRLDPTRARRSMPPPVPSPMRRGSPLPGSTPARCCHGCRAPRRAASSPSAATAERIACVARCARHSARPRCRDDSRPARRPPTTSPRAFRSRGWRPSTRASPAPRAAASGSTGAGSMPRIATRAHASCSRTPSSAACRSSTAPRAPSSTARASASRPRA